MPMKRYHAIQRINQIRASKESLTTTQHDIGESVRGNPKRTDITLAWLSHLWAYSHRRNANSHIHLNILSQQWTSWQLGNCNSPSLYCPDSKLWYKGITAWQQNMVTSKIVHVAKLTIYIVCLCIFSFCEFHSAATARASGSPGTCKTLPPGVFSFLVSRFIS